MNVETALNRRRSCRSFTGSMLKDEYTSYLLTAADKAPYASGGPRRFVYTVNQPHKREKLYEACCLQNQVLTCAAAFIFFGTDIDTILRSKHPKYIFDCAAAAMCVDLLATSEKLGTCWIGNFHIDQIQDLFNTQMIPVIILVVGYK